MTSVTLTVNGHPVAYYTTKLPPVTHSPTPAQPSTPSSHYDAAVAKIQQQEQQANQPVHPTATRGQQVNTTA